MTLEYMAMAWLRFEKNCPVALFERTPRSGHGEPDVLGITRARYLLEVEIKRSVSDFRANANKYFHRCREVDGDDSMYPSMYWFLTPSELTEKVLPLVPRWAGLLRGDQSGIKIVKDAPRNLKSKRLTTKECVALASRMANQIYSMARRICGEAEWDKHNERWIQQDYEI